ncbi:MAG: hypothetical protein LBU91_00415, partial [Bacteroidales bacterium]|nr:hypothetical protein [Bacteroidales bacterium]
MKINSAKYTNLTNAEHFQFMTDLNGLIIAKTPEAIDIATEYPEFKAALADEDRSFKIVPKSALTKSIEAADEERDRFY